MFIIGSCTTGKGVLIKRVTSNRVTENRVTAKNTEGKFKSQKY